MSALRRSTGRRCARGTRGGGNKEGTLIDSGVVMCGEWVEKRDGTWIGAGVGTADCRDMISGYWSDLSSALKKVLKNNIFSG